ncbi:MAG: epoxyqueuosine reductase [Muribaculaceae bacterium]
MELYDRWLDRGDNGTLDYMERWRDVRNDTRLLIPADEGGPARTLIICIFAYPHHAALGDPDGIAAYAHARTDYHYALKAALAPVAAAIDSEYGSVSRVVTDSAPLRERYWAVRAGLGVIRRNNQLYVPGYGANFHIATIVTTAALPEAHTPPPLTLAQVCPDSCRLCVDACPTGALRADGTIDCRRCLSCITIENARGEQPDVPRAGAVFGCDACRLACPHTRASRPAPVIDALQPNPALAATDWQTMTGGQFRRLFGSTALARAGLKGIRNNFSKIKN